MRIVPYSAKGRTGATVMKMSAWSNMTTLFPYENGFSADGLGHFVSCWADCIFFNGLTQHNGQWIMVYGGSEYYSCRATAPA